MNQYRPRLTIYTPTKALRFPMTWTPMALYEARDGKLRSGQAMTKVLWWREGRRRMKRLSLTWDVVRIVRRPRNGS